MNVTTPCLPHPFPKSNLHAHTEITAVFYDEPAWGFSHLQPRAHEVINT